MVAQVRQIHLEQLLEQLQRFGHELLVESVEGHDRVLQHQVWEVHERFVLVLDVEEDDRDDVAHALYVSDVRSVHRKSPQNLQDVLMVLLSFLEQLHLRESSGNIKGN